MNISKNLPNNVSFYGYGTTKSGKKITIWEIICFNCSKKRLVKRADHAKAHAYKMCKYCSNKNNHPQGNYKNIRLSFIKKYELHAKSRNKEWKINLDYLADLAKKQNYKCALTNQNLIFKGNFNDITASLDRIDSSKGYVKNNVQWVHKSINMMKGQLSMQDFIKNCKLVVETLL